MEDVPDLTKYLTDDLLSVSYRKLKPDGAPRTWGHCYIVTEALYHLLGGKDAGWTPQVMTVDNTSHWFLRRQDGTVVDQTGDQFGHPIDHSGGRGCGFLTKLPSYRTSVLLRRYLDEPGTYPPAPSWKGR